MTGCALANRASVSAKTLTPFSIASGEENSSGLWLHPFLHGMKIMPAGPIWAMKRASWYARLTSLMDDSPNSSTEAAIALVTCNQDMISFHDIANQFALVSGRKKVEGCRVTSWGFSLHKSEDCLTHVRTDLQCNE